MSTHFQDWLQRHCSLLPWDANTVDQDELNNFIVDGDSSLFLHHVDLHDEEDNAKGVPFWKRRFWKTTEVASYFKAHKGDLERMLPHFENDYDKCATSLLLSMACETVSTRLVVTIVHKI